MGDESFVFLPSNLVRTVEIHLLSVGITLCRRLAAVDILSVSASLFVVSC
jgi:hypothetical protein